MSDAGSGNAAELGRLTLSLEAAIRHCRESDLGNLEWFGAFSLHRQIIRDTFARATRGEGAMLVADVAGFPVGQLWIDFTRGGPDGVLLWALRVMPMFRGRKIATALVDAAENLARARGFSAAEIGVEPGNAPAKKLYRALGYQVTGTRQETLRYTTPQGEEQAIPFDEVVLRKSLLPKIHERARHLGIRWTIGDVSENGFEALKLSLWGARRVFGPEAQYVVCVNTIGIDRARALAGEVPDNVVWRDTTGELSPVVAARIDRNMAEGVGWKFAPLQLFPDRYELALDNDCILWRAPDAIERWLSSAEGRCVIAEDVREGFGAFAAFCGREPRNSGIRGLPPGFDLAAALSAVLDARPVTLTSELDEQGLQVAAVSREGPPLVVRVDEVTICSPFPPHVPRLGTAGAHFVGLNARRLPWSQYGRPATEWIADNWRRLRPEVYARVGRELPLDHP